MNITLYYTFITQVTQSKEKQNKTDEILGDNPPPPPTSPNDLEFITWEESSEQRFLFFSFLCWLAETRSLILCFCCFVFSEVKTLTTNVHAFVDVTWRDVTWRDVTWHDVTWRDVTYLLLTSVRAASAGRENEVSKVNWARGKETLFKFSGPYSEIRPAKFTNHTARTN